MKLLTVCMIVKNEEAVIARCLDSVKDLADEIIVVDTGSTDKTREIVQQYKQATVYDFTWIHDFSAAKNEAIRHATGQWILVLDADEYLNTDELPKFKKFLQKTARKATVVYAMPIINYLGETMKDAQIEEVPVTRLFPNFKGFCYERPIHEQVVSTKANTVVDHELISYRIHHTGYLRETYEQKNKHERNLNIFKQYQEQGQFADYDYFTLGNQYASTQDYEQALVNYQIAFKTAPRDKSWYTHLLMGLTRSYTQLNRLEESWSLLEKEWKQFEEFPEYYLLRALHYDHCGFYQQAYDDYVTALQIAEKRARINEKFWLISPGYGFELPLDNLIQLSIKLDKPKDKVVWLTQRLMQDAKHIPSLLLLLEQLSIVESAEEINRLLRKIYNYEDISHLFLLFQTILSVANKELAALLSGQLAMTNYKYSRKEQLRILLMNGDQQGWLAEWKEVSEITKDFILQTLTACLAWNIGNPIKDLQLSTDHELYHTTLLAEQLLSTGTLTTEIFPEDCQYIFLIAKDLFMLGYYEAYDTLVNLAAHPQLVNMLANYFYNHNHVDLALNYYSLLLEHNEADRSSMENIAYYHINHGDTAGAVPFLKATLEKSRSVRIYGLLLQCVEPAERAHYWQELKESFPSCSSLSFVLPYSK